MVSALALDVSAVGCVVGHIWGNTADMKSLLVKDSASIPKDRPTMQSLDHFFKAFEEQVRRPDLSQPSVRQLQPPVL
jgi:hypothetical protein